jgi:prepilin-type processing-associated H-X9-DG protein
LKNNQRKEEGKTMTETINRIAGVWLNWQWAMLWQTTVLIGLVAIIDRLIRKRAWPQLRYALWLLVFVKLILPPTLTSPVSLTSRVPALAQRAIQAGMQGQLPSADNRATQLLSAKPTALSTTEAPSSLKSSAANPPETLSVQDRPAETGPDHTPIIASALSWPVYVLGIWLAGVAALAAGLHIRLRQISKEHYLAQPQDVPAWFEGLVSQTAAELGLRRVPQVVFSERVCCPAVFGVFRPVLLFPVDRLTTTQQEARHILLHELAHIKRGDLLVHAGYMILATVYWFNPLLWLIRKHVQNLRELCCDATVAGHLKEETAAYRETLLATGRALLARPVDPGLGLLGLFENSGWLLVRLQWLEKKTWRHPWLRRTLVAAVVVLMLGCILPMASGKAADKEKPTQQYRVTLSNGITLELIAVRKKGLQEWWRPDGTPLAQAPYDSSEENTSLSNPYEFALRYENLPKGATGSMEITPGGGSWGGTIPEWMDKLKPQKAGKPVEGVAYLVVSQKPETEQVTVKVCLATGSWKTAALQPAYGNSGIGSWLNVLWSAPYERQGKAHAVVTYGSRIAHRYDARLTALDVNNVEHEATEHGRSGVGGDPDGFDQLASEFGMPLDDIAAFYLQTRPYTWIEFRNVALRPGKGQTVQTVVTEPNEPAESRKHPLSPQESEHLRDYSLEVLRTFHLACVRYLDEHPGQELPRKPWQLKYPMTNPELAGGDRNAPAYVGPLQYVICVGYFRPEGFRGLRRADFQSSAAQRTPILYCKDCLEAENGQGTNVLFGDGHVEWVTADGLRKLQATPLP